MCRLQGYEYCLGVLLLSLSGDGYAIAPLSFGVIEFEGGFSGHEYLKKAAEVWEESISFCGSDCIFERLNHQNTVAQTYQSCAYIFNPGENVSEGVADLPEGCELWFSPGEYRLNHTVYIKPYQSIQVVQLQDVSGEVGDAVFPGLMAVKKQCEYAGCTGLSLVMVGSTRLDSRRAKAFFIPGQGLEAFRPLLVLPGYNRIQDVVVTDAPEHRGVMTNITDPRYLATISFFGVGCVSSRVGYYQGERDAGLGQSVTPEGGCASMALAELLQDNTVVLWTNFGKSLLIEAPPKKKEPKGGKQREQKQPEGKEQRHPASAKGSVAPAGKGSGASAPGGGQPPDWNKILEKQLNEKPPWERELVIELLEALYEFFFSITDSGRLQTRLAGFCTAVTEAGFGNMKPFRDAMTIYSIRKFQSHVMAEKALAFALEQLFFSEVSITGGDLINLVRGLNNRVNYPLYRELRSQLAAYKNSDPELYARMFPGPGASPGSKRRAAASGTVTSVSQLDSGDQIGGSLRVARGRSRPPIPLGLYSGQASQPGLEPVPSVGRSGTGNVQSIIRSLQGWHVGQSLQSQVPTAHSTLQASALSGAVAVMPLLGSGQSQSDAAGEGLSNELFDMLFNSSGSDQALSCLYHELGSNGAFFLMVELGLWKWTCSAYSEELAEAELITGLRQFIRGNGEKGYERINEKLCDVLKRYTKKTIEDLKHSLYEVVRKRTE